MKRLGLVVAGLLAASVLPGGSAFASSLCTGTLQDLIAAGVCNFDVFAIQVVSFSTTGSTQAGLLDASQIMLTATALTGEIGATVSLTTAAGAGPFQASNAPVGTTVSAQYHISYQIIAPNLFLSEILQVVGGTVANPANYTVTKTGEGVADVVNNIGKQTNTTLLPGDSSSIFVTDDIVLNASTTRGVLQRPPVVGSTSIASIQNQFGIVPPAIPEPVTFVLCGTGLVLFGFMSRRLRRK
jgi:hypothetical protein